MNLAKVLDEEILQNVEKASRYLGTEVNAVHKSPGDVEVRMALAFPDLYDLGLGNLGIHILYDAVNRLDWAYCERLYSPGLDMEHELRSRGLKLFALETKDEVDHFDGIGITLQSELTYTNILNLIDLAGLPLRSVERSDDAPLIFAGGPAVFNPEPIAPFIDFFVIGDGEDVVIEIAEVMRRMKGRPRKARLLAMSMLEGIYVPELYPFETLESGAIVPKLDAPPIRKRLAKDLDGATFPTDYIVPFTQQVHDRVSLEVLRGCTQGCRFCQAGMVTRPVRERSIEKVDELMKRTLDNTGYEEVSLVSLSTCDYSQVKKLVENAVDVARSARASVSLPSLRLDSFSVELSDMVAEQRKSGVTFAPEAASPRLRQVINKFIPDEELLSMSAEVYKRNWDLVKLYFMIGLPTERDEDVEAIADLAIRTVRHGQEFNRRAKVNMGVSTFVPKPFTPFQWARQITVDETIAKQDLLQAQLRPFREIKFGRHEPEETYLEGLVSRSDRRAADLLEAAWKKGCRFDAWREHLRYDLWLEAVHETGFDVDDATRERDPDERLPWDHIDIYIPKQWFKEDWARAKELQWAEDCRRKRCHKCGVIDEERELCATMLRDHIDGRKEEAEWVRTPREPWVEPDPVQRLWFRVSRTKSSRFLSHLESANAWLRALRRAKVPLAYSQGFHPQPRVAFSSAMPLGEESVGEYMDMMLIGREDPNDLLARIQAVLPEGFDATSVVEVPFSAKSLMALNHGGEYLIELPHLEREQVAERVKELMEAEEITLARKGKTRTKARGQKGRFKKRDRVMRMIDIRPMLHSLELVDAPVTTLKLTVVNHEGRPGKAREFVKLLTKEPQRARVRRLDTLVEHADGWRSLSANWASLAEQSAAAQAALTAEQA